MGHPKAELAVVPHAAGCNLRMTRTSLKLGTDKQNPTVFKAPRFSGVVPLVKMQGLGEP